MKVNKEEMVGMMVALESFLKRDAAAEWQELERRVNVLAAAVANVKGLKTSQYVYAIANHVPHLKLEWDKTALKLTLADIRKQLRDGNPSIEISPYAAPSGSAKEEMMVGVWPLQPNEVEIVARRLREVFTAA